MFINGLLFVQYTMCMHVNIYYRYFCINATLQQNTMFRAGADYPRVPPPRLGGTENGLYGSAKGALKGPYR